METNKDKPKMNFGAIPTSKKKVVKKTKTSKKVKAEKVTKPAKQKVVKRIEEKKLGRKRHVPEDWIKLGVKVDPKTNDDLKIALVHFKEAHPSQDVFVNAAIEHYIKHLSKKG